MPDAKKVRELWEEGTNRRRGFDLEAYENIALLMGEHYLITDKQSGRIYKQTFADGRVRLAIPLIKPIWRTEIAKLTKTHPVPELRPSSNSQKDRQSAKVAQRVLNAEMQRVDFHEKFIRLWTWVSSIGCAYLHMDWDPKANDGMGDVVLDVVPHLEVVLDPACRNSTEEGRWVTHGRVMAKEEVYDRFGLTANPDSTENNNIFSQITHLSDGGIVDTSSDGVLVLRHWQLPSKNYPKGGVWTVINDKLIDEFSRDEYPFEHNQLPFVDFHHVRVPGRFAGQSIIRDLWSSQRDYNAARSKLAEARALYSAPKLLAQHGSLPGIERLSPMAGEILEWMPTGPYKPEPLQLPSIPAYIYQQQETALKEMMDIAGQHEVSRGQVPAAGLPASALLALQEADDTKLGPIIRGLEQSVARYGRMHLELCQQFWQEPRTVATWSEGENRYVEDLFKGAAIGKQTDVHVVPGSALPKSKRQQQELVLELYKLQVITDPMFVLKNLDMPGVDALVDALEVDVKHAERENAMFMSLARFPNMESAQAEGATPPVAEPWHNHMVHIQVIDNFRKTEDFEGLPDWVRMMVADHSQQHKDIEMRMNMEASVQDGAMAEAAQPPSDPGMPPPGGPGGGPARPPKGGGDQGPKRPYTSVKEVKEMAQQGA